MTTSTDEVLEPQGPRNINQLMDLPYSQMSDEEIDLVIEFKAARKAQEAKFAAEWQAIQETLQKNQETHLKMAQEASENLNALTAHALKRLEEVS